MNHRLAKNSTITTAHDSRLSTSWERTGAAGTSAPGIKMIAGGDQRQRRNSHILTLSSPSGVR